MLRLAQTDEGEQRRESHWVAGVGEESLKGFDTLDKLEGIKLARNPQSNEISKPLQDVHIVDVQIVDSMPYAAEIAKWKTENNVK